VFAEEEATLLRDSAADDAVLEQLLRRREAGEPLEVLLGWVGFAGRRIVVRQGVFVPRRRTELLARLAASALPAGGIAVDLCCGTGAVAAVLADEAGAEVHAVDIDPVAVACARLNLPGGAGVHVGDLWEALPDRLRGRVDVVAANAPYVPTGEIPLLPPEARDHEPRHALDGGADGAAVHRRIAAGAVGWLAPGGTVLVEAGPGRAGPTRAALRAVGLVTDVVVDEEVDGCVVRGVAPGAAARRVRAGETG
jgi:release factor glutamine methyltransferase